MKTKKKIRIPIIIGVCAALALSAYLIYAHEHYADRVPPGTLLAGEDVGGFTPDEARRAAQEIYDGIVMNLTLKDDSGLASAPAIEKTLTAAELGIAFDADVTARGALDSAADEWFITRVNPFVKKEVGLSVLVDEEAIARKIEEDFEAAVVETELPEIKYDKDAKVFVMTPGVVGTTLDTARFVAEVKAGALRAGEFSYDVHLDPIMPQISDEAANEAKALAEKAIGAKVSFEKDGEVVYKAGKNSKASWITFTADEDGGVYDVGVNDEKIVKFLKTTASAKLVEKPLPELIVREIDMEAAEKAADEEAKEADKEETPKEADEADKADKKDKKETSKEADKKADKAEKADKADKKADKKASKEKEKDKKEKAAQEDDEEKAEEQAEVEAAAKKADAKSGDDKNEEASDSSGEDAKNDDGDEKASDDGNAKADGAAAPGAKVTEPAPKAARVVREGEEGLMIADRTTLAARIGENMLAGRDIKLTPTYEPLPYETEEIGPDFGKWIETDLTRQVTYLWNGNKKLKTYVVSTGKNVTPTITGTYQIYMKRDHHDMKGYDPIKEKDYVQPDVRYISYFEGAYAYHAAYWHNAFGTQVSHGCINMKTPEAKYLYDWAPVGTTCIIHY